MAIRATRQLDNKHNPDVKKGYTTTMNVHDILLIINLVLTTLVLLIVLPVWRR
jgi:hypothetical protein